MKNSSSHFNLLAMFAVVIEQGSFSAAAVHLNTNQSTISTAMARLRELVGQELFVRSGRRIIPTSYAENLYEQVEQPVAQLTGVLKSLETFDPATSKRKFVLAAPEHLQWIFHESFSNSPYPNLTLEVFEQPDTEEQAYRICLRRNTMP
ncbi:lysR-family transcriptional regulator [Vibrio ishigakensis]|uniref:LysR-family transcriptional regulator n=1 Tax=Vibrio ishigakensis TaxID=1481914 RepID=A0A0B8QMW1_9VIBR|nr:lysR-family transcriptional regulator [Vibrio ishigakensis]